MRLHIGLDADAPTSDQGSGHRIQNRGVGIILPGLVVVGGRGLSDQKMSVVGVRASGREEV